MNEPKNILIVRTDRIGDVILTIPMAKVLKENFPGCRVSLLVRSYTAPLLKANKYIDEVLVLDESEKGFINKNLKIVKPHQFDTCFVVSPSFKIALLMFLAGIKKTGRHRLPLVFIFI